MDEQKLVKLLNRHFPIPKESEPHKYEFSSIMEEINITISEIMSNLKKIRSDLAELKPIFTRCELRINRALKLA